MKSELKKVFALYGNMVLSIIALPALVFFALGSALGEMCDNVEI